MIPQKSMDELSLKKGRIYLFKDNGIYEFRGAGEKWFLVRMEWKYKDKFNLRFMCGDWAAWIQKRIQDEEIVEYYSYVLLKFYETYEVSREELPLWISRGGVYSKLFEEEIKKAL